MVCGTRAKRAHDASNTKQRVTKRTILSTIAEIFDPLGHVGSAIICARIILQRLWELQFEWDETVPHDVHTLWMDSNNQLKAMWHTDVVAPMVMNRFP